MSLIASVVLPLVMVAGTAFICYIVMQARLELAVSREREKLSVALAELRGNELLLEERLKSAQNLAFRQGFDPIVDANPAGMIPEAEQVWQDPPSEPLRIPISRITVLHEPAVREVMIAAQEDHNLALAVPWPGYGSPAMLRGRLASSPIVLGPPSAKSAWISTTPRSEPKVVPYRRTSSGLR